MAATLWAAIWMIANGKRSDTPGWPDTPGWLWSLHGRIPKIVQRGLVKGRLYK